MSKTADLAVKLAAASAMGLRYNYFRHYKGGIYTVHGFVIDTDDGSVRVLYYRIGGPDYDAKAESGIRFVRPLVEFMGKLEDGSQRFERVVARSVEGVDIWETAEAFS